MLDISSERGGYTSPEVIYLVKKSWNEWTYNTNCAIEMAKLDTEQLNPVVIHSI